MKKKPIVVLMLCGTWAGQVGAATCTDPSGNALHIQEMMKNAAMWAEEKSLQVAEIAQEKATSLYETLRAEYNASATISATTTAISSTSNAASEERYSTSPSACASFTRAKSILNSLTDSCDNPISAAVFENNQAQITDCGHGGTGLNCGRVAKRRGEITSHIVEAIKEKDGDVLLNVLNGGALLGLGDSPMQVSDEEDHQLAMSLLLGVEDMPALPRLADGSLPKASDLNSSREMSQWARRHVLRSIPNTALADIHRLYAPQKDGSASTMAQIEDQVNYYSSEEFIRLLSNTNDKSQLPSNWNELTPAQKHDWNNSAPTNKKLTSSEQVLRMLGEMEALSLRLQFMSAEASLSINALTAIQLKEL